MKAIKRNIVGLLKFTGLLFLMIIPVSRTSKPRIETPQKRDKYEAIIGPSEPLPVAETKFCPQCHVAVAQVRHTKRGTEIIQNGRILATVGSNVIVGKGGKDKGGFPIRCPNGHTVRVE